MILYALEGSKLPNVILIFKSLNIKNFSRIRISNQILNITVNQISNRSIGKSTNLQFENQI